MASTNENGNSGAAAIDRYGAGASVPLIVRMPDGESHQVDIPPSASVKDLKTSIANLPWPLSDSDPQQQSLELEFGGETLNDNQTLSHYNIPDVYDHADGFLKTISDSGYLDHEKKVEALDKACAVVRGISRGEKDMEKLLGAVFDDLNDDTPSSPSAQPTLRSMRRSRPSRIPSLNFGALNPIGVGGKSNSKLFSPSAPPTPRQLIRKLSLLRPDLYDTAAAEKATSSLSLGIPTSMGNRPAVPRATEPQNQGNGDLKRGNTWFQDIMTTINSSLRDPRKRGGDDQDHGDDVEGNSEGENSEDPDALTDPNVSGAKSSNPVQIGDILKHSASPTSSIKTDGTAPKPGSQLASTTAQNDQLKINEPETSSVGGSKSSAAPAEDSASTARAQEGSEKRLNVEGAPVTPPDVEGTTSQGSATQLTPSTNGNKVIPGRPIPNQDKQVIGLTPERQTPATGSQEPKLPRKRGRKRKNPHLSEEERKAQRQAQNRESAKLSRIRRKHMTLEYERRVNSLEGENENLRGTISALEDRLQMLQNLLTISVQRRAIPQVHPSMMPPQPNAPILPGGQNRLGATLGTNVPITGQQSLASQGGLVPGALNPQAMLGNQSVMGRAGVSLHGGMMPSHVPGSSQRPPINANGTMMGAPQTLPGSAPMRQSGPSQSNPLANLRYKSF